MSRQMLRQIAIAGTFGLLRGNLAHPKNLAPLGIRNYTPTTHCGIRSPIMRSLHQPKTFRRAVIVASQAPQNPEPGVGKTQQSLQHRLYVAIYVVKEMIESFLRKLAPYILGAVLLCCAMISAAPYALSHPTGLKAALAVVNIASPVTLHLDSLQAAWNKPLTASGLRVYKKIHSSTDAPYVKESLVEINGGTAVVSSIPLIDAQRVTTTATLWDILRSKDTGVVVTAPRIDTTLNEDGVFKLLQAAQDAGFTPRPPVGEIRRVVAGEGSRRRGEQAQQQRVKVPLSLQTASAVVPFSGEIREGGLYVAISEGQLLMPQEFRDFLGGRIHFDILRGAPTIEEDAAENQAALGNSDNDEKDPNYPSGLGLGSVAWARVKPTVTLPPHVGTLQSPIALRIDSPSLHCSLEGWQTSNRYTYLTNPLQAEVQLTPDLAQWALSRLNPLLGDTVALQGNSRVAVSVAPREGLWPASEVTVRVEPLKVAVGQGAAVTKALGALSAVDGRLGAVMKGAGVDVQLSPLVAEVIGSGEIIADRVDLYVGVRGFRTPLHFVSWGAAHTASDGRLDMILAVPTDTLELMGISGLPADFAVPLRVTGTVARPEIEVWRASKDVAGLVLRSKAGQLAESRFGIPDWIKQELSSGKDGSSGMGADYFKLPPQVE